jgi:hypothetical protein
MMRVGVREIILGTSEKYTGKSRWSQLFCGVTAVAPPDGPPSTPYQLRCLASNKLHTANLGDDLWWDLVLCDIWVKEVLKRTLVTIKYLLPEAAVPILISMAHLPQG